MSAVARNVRRLAVLPGIVALRPRIRAVSWDVYQRVAQNEHEVQKFGEFGGNRRQGGGRSAASRWGMQTRTHGERNHPVDELGRKAAVAVEDVASDEVVRGALAEGRDAWIPRKQAVQQIHQREV